MSCNCANKNSSADPTFACLCDQIVFPPPLNIGAGLSTLPRQIATFPEFRQAMLEILQGQEVQIIDNNNLTVEVTPLTNWRATGTDDLGLMLLEMWAYICDSLSFYDEIIANEVYIRTSQLRPDVRRLVGLLGYLPRPAVGSVVQLAALATGRLDVPLPAGTAFRSTAFGANPAQVFELDTDASINALTNQWTITAPHTGKIVSANPTELLVLPQSEIKQQALLLLTDSDDVTQNQVVTVQTVQKQLGVNQQQYTQVIFTSATNLAVGTVLASLSLMKSTQSAGLWTVSAADPSLTSTTLILNGLNRQVKTGNLIMVVYNTDARWFQVTLTSDVARQATPDSNMTVNGTAFNLPGVTTLVTQLTLDVPINSAGRKASGAMNWDNSIINGITVYFGLQIGATVIDEPEITLSSSDPLYLDGYVETPPTTDALQSFLLQDKNTIGASVGGSIDFTSDQLTLDQGATWSPDLTSPVTVYGNVITASRGQTVQNEVLGSGDATASNQTFKLKKAPLTYHLSPTADNANGISDTLTVYVDGIMWTEVNNFYGALESDPIYIVRQDDDGNSLVTFGDGVRGARLPSGTNNIIGNYRFGGEAACPLAGAVNQISKPVKGLQSVNNVLAAYGGADAEVADDLRTSAPKSVLILGRVVSMDDMGALASSFPGVDAVQTEWRWNKGKQQAAAHIFYVGEDGLASALSQRIRNLSDPDLTIVVEQAQAIPLAISMNVEIDPKYLQADVIQALQESLLDTQTGLLAPENIGIGQPLYRSQLFEAILSIPGTTTVDSIFLNGNSFDAYAVTPGAGCYYDVEQASLTINGN